MKSNKIKLVGMVSLLVALILAIAIFGFSCVSGLTPIGWSGGAVSNNKLYLGSIAEGRLIFINLADQSIEKTDDPLKMPAQGGLLGCSSALSCGGGTTRVPIYGTPVVSDNIVYIAGYNGKIYAYNAANLASRWIFPREGYLNPIVGGIAIAQNKLFFGCSDGWVYALDAATGDLLNSYQTGDKIWGTPTVEGNTLYIGSFDKKLYAFNTADFSPGVKVEPKWSYLTEGSIIAKPLVYDGVVYIGSFDKKMYALNASDGKPKWQEPFIGGNWFWAQPALVNDTLYAGCLDGFVYMRDAATGAEVAQPLNLGSQLASQPVVFENYVIFATHNGDVYKINSTTREMTKIVALKEALKHDVTVDGPLTLNEEIVYLQTSDAVLQRIDLKSGNISSITLVSQ